MEAKHEQRDTQHEKRLIRTRKRETNRRRRGRNLLHKSVPTLLPLLRRTTYFLLPVDTPKSSSGASLTGAHTVTLNLPQLAVLARLSDTAAGDVVRGRRSVGELSTLLVMVDRLVLVWMLVVVWDRHGSGHRGRQVSRVEFLVVVVVVDLNMGRVVGGDGPGGRTMDWLWNRDGSGGNGRAVELHDPKISHRDHTIRTKNKSRKTYLRNVQLVRRLLGQSLQHLHLLVPNHLRPPKIFTKPLELHHPRTSGDERYRGVLNRNLNRNRSREQRRRGANPHLNPNFVRGGRSRSRGGRGRGCRRRKGGCGGGGHRRHRERRGDLLARGQPGLGNKTSRLGWREDHNREQQDRKARSVESAQRGGFRRNQQSTERLTRKPG